MKARVNWTLSNEVVQTLEQAKRLNGNNISISQLVEYAVQKVFRNRREMLAERMRHHQQQLMKCKDELESIDEQQNHESNNKNKRWDMATVPDSVQE
jgi:hypothetical protein